MKRRVEPIVIPERMYLLTSIYIITCFLEMFVHKDFAWNLGEG